MSATLNVVESSPPLAAEPARVRARGGARAARRVVADLLALTKPRIVLMVLVTTIVGYEVALIRPADWTRLLHLILGTALAAGGTLALNQYLERHVDARMKRTRRRPLPDGRLLPVEALTFGALTTVAGTIYLAFAVNAPAALVCAATSLLYLFVYTPLKLRTPWCTVAGAVPGALPPVIGWLGARDAIDAGTWALFGIVFFWQLPHTFAIAHLHRGDYARAGVRVLAVIDPDGGRTSAAIVASAVASALAGLAPALIGLAGHVYLVGAGVAGAALVTLALIEAVTRSAGAARSVLLASLLYLPLVLTLLVADKL